jgi:hypothetical protein
MSISKGRKKTLIDRAAFDWDCGDGEGGDQGQQKQQVLNQLNLDVEVSFIFIDGEQTYLQKEEVGKGEGRVGVGPLAKQVKEEVAKVICINQGGCRF